MSTDTASPVPADAFLDASEVPFTRFGWRGYGALDIRVFEQDEFWVNIHGEAVRLEEMDSEYVANVIALLEESAPRHYRSAVHRWLEKADEVPVWALPAPVGADLDWYGGEGYELGVVFAYRWLDDTPLMRRLRALAG